MQNVSQEHSAFLKDVVQKLLAQTEYRQIVAWVIIILLSTSKSHLFFYQREFTFLLLPLLSRKLKKTIPLLLKHPPLLAHTIYQTLLFDSALTKEGFLLQGTSSLDSGAEWAGISEIILGNSDWFETWLAGEKDCKLFA